MINSIGRAMVALLAVGMIAPACAPGGIKTGEGWGVGTPPALATASKAEEEASPAVGATSITTEGSVPGSDVKPGTSEPVTGWWGLITSLEPGAQFDDCFERQDLGQAIIFGIDSPVPEVEAQIEALRDSGKVVHLYGILFSNVPDCNGSQVQVERIEVEG